MKRDAKLRRMIVALVAVMIVFCVTSVGLFYMVADVKDLGWRLGGPVALTGEMPGLFGVGCTWRE